MDVKIEKITLPRHRRVIVISDIHGNLPYLKGLLAKLSLRRDDVLILLGDLVEKGPFSLDTVRYILSLRESCELHAMCGNCDMWFTRFGREDLTWPYAYLDWLERNGFPGYYVQMAAECGERFDRNADFARLLPLLRERFREEFAFFDSLPHVLDAGEYIFVHGGLPAKRGEWESYPPRAFLKNDFFAAQGKKFDEWVIVGHLPVMLYREDIVSAVPRIDRESRIISIDGGNVLKDDGQLNALILENGEFSYTWYDEFPLIRALDPQRESEASHYIQWGKNAVELVRREGEFVRVRQLCSGYEMDVPADFLYERGGELLVNDCTDYCPAVEEGELLSLVRETSRGALIKKNGISGRYRGRYTKLE